MTKRQWAKRLRRQGAPVALTDAGSALERALAAALQPVERIAVDYLDGALDLDAVSSPSRSPEISPRSEIPAPADERPLLRSFRYLGMDSSIAPGLDTPSLTDSYEFLRLGAFGGPGTLAISGVVTRALKALPLRLTGESWYRFDLQFVNNLQLRLALPYCGRWR